MSVKQNSPEKAQTREEAKKNRESAPDQAKLKRKRIRIRLIPIWLRIVMVVLLLGASLIAGAMVGYSIMGDGKPSEIFEKSTWQHISNLIHKE
ncbi:DNA-directed RNA polymerase subunit beta [Cytobacillus spongiae]|uniref:DNA-directed RNA polymerase subunit beta n=1 Tax=Cytobacillus spongiae TaxID=2901381 RepID=UPI001F479A67|nr:DNA-directed RNA polymerase subunit beta [Cytobacillus spongiae]UII55707.1 DNA-directed RNA polymerase subunit beta [Cytobacillus spongiae]